MVPAVFQIIAAVIIVMVLLLAALYQYNKDKFNALRSVGSVHKSVPIFTGTRDMSTNKNEMYETVDSTSGSYRDLVPSVNQLSGIEYSYNFWMYIDQDGLTDDASTTRTASTAANSVLGSMMLNDYSPSDLDPGLTSTYITAGNRDKAPVMLFLRGDPHGYYFNKVCSNPAAGAMKYDVLVKNPLVKLENAGNALTVEFNTVNSPDSCTGATDAIPSWSSGNAHKVGIRGLRNDNLKNKWFMVTVVIAETAPAMPLSSRYQTTCMIYINGKIAQTQKVPGGSVRNPTGNVYVNPVIKDAAGNAASIDLTNGSNSGKLQLADLTYYNYAITTGELATIFSTGPSRIPAVPAATSSPNTPFTTMSTDVSSGTISGAFSAIGNRN